MQFCPSRFCKIVLAMAVLQMVFFDSTELQLDGTELPTVARSSDEVCQEPPSTVAGTAIREKLIHDVFS